VYALRGGKTKNVCKALFVLLQQADLYILRYDFQNISVAKRKTMTFR